MLHRLGVLIVVPVVLITALAAGISAFLNYGKFSSTLAEVEGARFALVVKGVKAGVEANLNLGLQLTGLSVAQEILDRERHLVPETQAVVVFAADGEILYASGEKSGLARAPADWLHNGEWVSESARWRAVGNSIVNPFGGTVGGVAVLYPHDVRDRVLSAMMRKLEMAAGWTALGTAVFSLLCMGFLLRRTQRLAEKFAVDIAPGSESGKKDTQAIKTSVLEAHSTLAEMAGALQVREKNA